MDQPSKIMKGGNDYNKNDHLHLIFNSRTTPSFLSEKDNKVSEIKDAPYFIKEPQGQAGICCHASVSGPINGLYCVVSRFNVTRCRTINLWNPGTGELHELPPIPHPTDDHTPDIDRVYTGYGYDPSSKDRKVIAIVEYGDRYDGDHFMCFYLYSLASNSWQQLDPFQIAHPSLLIKLNDGKVTFQPEMDDSDSFSLHNSCHWSYDQYTNLLSFDFVSNTFRTSRFLKESDVQGECTLATLDGCLAVAYPMSASGKYSDPATRIDVFVMKEYGAEDSWTKVYSITLNAPGYLRGIIGNKMFVQEENECLVSYCLGSPQQEYHRYGSFPCDYILPFQGSLDPIKQVL